jgi:hypothetical protein
MFFGVYVIFTCVAPHRGQLAAKCNPRWQPTRRLAVSCELGEMPDSNPGLQDNSQVNMLMYVYIGVMFM